MQLFHVLFLLIVPICGELEIICEELDGLIYSMDYNDEETHLNIHFRQTNMTWYHIDLFANFTNIQINPSHCLTFPMLAHSTTAMTSTNDFSATFHHIYSGLYRLQIVPWLNNQSRHSSAIHFKVKTEKLPVQVQQWTTRFLIHTFPMKSSITVEFVPAASEYEFQIYEIILIYGVSHCDQAADSGSPATCYANQTNPECTFDNLLPGSYCALVKPLDERCVYGKVWQVEDNCVVHSDIIYLSSSIPSENTKSLSRGDNGSMWPLASLGVVGFLLVAAAVWLIQFRLRKRTWPNRVSLPGVEQLENSCKPREFKKKILLLWIPDSSEFKQTVEQFKVDLSNKCCAKVFDIYDEALYNTICMDPINWMNQMIADQDMRIVVVSSAKLQQNFNRLLPVNICQFEHLVLYGLNQLLIQKAAMHSLYSTTFVVRFSNDCTSDIQFIELTPFRCFTIPAHLSELISYLNM